LETRLGLRFRAAFGKMKDGPGSRNSLVQLGSGEKKIQSRKGLKKRGSSN